MFERSVGDNDLIDEGLGDYVDQDDYRVGTSES